MGALLERADQAVSITDLTRSAKEYLNRLNDGVQSRFVVMKNNQPEAVMLSVEVFESMMDELEDLRIELVSVKRLANLNELKLVSHDDVMKEFGL